MFEASQWDELHVVIDGLHLFLSTDPNARIAAGAAPQPGAGDQRGSRRVWRPG